MKYFCTIYLALVLCSVGCDRSKSSDPPITTFKNDDKEFIRAVDEARKTLDSFIGQFQRPKPAQTYFSIKAKFPYSEKGGEHIWISDLKYDGTNFTGRIGNNPQYATGIKLGDSCTITPDMVTDWMIIEDGRLVGGTTIRLARSRKTLAERIEFDRSIGFRID